MKRLQTPLLLFCVFLFSAHCRTYVRKQQPKKAKPAPASAQKTLQQIKKTAEKKDFSQLIKELEAFIKDNKYNDLAFSGYLYMAGLYKKRGKTALACQTYGKSLSLPFFNSSRNKAVFALADCKVRRGQIKEAWETLEKHIQQQDNTLSVKYRAALLQWNLIKDKKISADKKLKTLSLLTVSAKQNREKTRWKKKGESFLSALTDGETEDLVKKRGSYGPFEGAVLFTAGERNWKKKQLKKARYFFKKTLAAPLSPLLEKKTRRYLKILQAHFKMNPYLVGVILPLSGRRRALGEKVLRGLYMGLGLPGDSPWQMVITDSKNHPDVVKANMEKLLYDHHVSAVVGGLSGETAEVMAQLADEFSMPCILLSQKNKLTENRKFVFQNAQTSESLVNHLVRDIEKFAGFKKLAVLYPEDSYGKEYSRLFSEAFSQTGGEIVKQVSYTMDEVDFKDSLRELFELKGREEEYKKLKQEYMEKHPHLSSRSVKLLPEYLLEPKRDFEGIFIPDSVKSLEKIIAYLKYFNIGDLYILGTNLWKPGRLPAAPEDLPLLFVNEPEIKQKTLHKTPFYVEYVRIFKAAPGFFERQAYNSARALTLALQGFPKSRLKVVEGLSKLKNLPGAFRPVRLSENRVFTYPLKTYVFHEGKVEELNSRKKLPDR